MIWSTWWKAEIKIIRGWEWVYSDTGNSVIQMLNMQYLMQFTLLEIIYLRLLTLHAASI